MFSFPYIVNATPHKTTGHSKGEGEYYKKTRAKILIGFRS